ncbi:dihydrodipicolinate synthase family protein [Aspergillus clavatus NRRL 1]|uniref:Dihydrodipicolinate synthetase family protein n=1 Tax=Aspergillus clavatus (strain ATCC 1007 / CBS 513.65 / DSM 816 / NCTC 3887 / NRRL 1 / QM 1276 / 107) TaxID=344612 RepID=A1C446_ASPCL|nr:dihydrodipicolinate synthetase family protein [Aspergillus clavatus NRRL 1]EAW15186.1 dihydrodipicolinate synthetase family protein [Aspergillus clavatus NRRL 1]
MATNGSPRNRPLVPGIYVPTVAFYTDDEEVDIPTVEKHATYLANAGVAGLVVQGSNGEAVHLDREERKLITAATRRALDAADAPATPVIVGCGAPSTRETIQLCTDAAAAGGDYVLVLPPSYYKSLVSPESLLNYFRDVASASPIPVLIYNFPGAAAGLDLSSDDILALAKHPNIVGVKLTCGNTGKLARIAAQAKPNFLTFGGSVDFTLQTLVAGGAGIIGGTANLIPRACVRLMDLYRCGKLDEAQKLQAVVARADWLAIKGGFVAVKSALQSYRGYGALPRRPCVAPSPEEAAALKEAFQESMEVERSLEVSA